jgi:glucuronate isomerase
MWNDANFLLTNTIAQKLYFDYAQKLPIIDWHNHIDPALIAQNTSFDNLYQLWVQKDPYKHRAMRISGIPESLITGENTPDYDKFLAWAQCFHKTMGSPLFHWSCMELKQVFGIDQLLSSENALEIWEKANELLKHDSFRASSIVKKFGVELLCTSDDLLDSLTHHIAFAKSPNTEGLACLPSLRSDTIISFNSGTFFEWMKRLEELTNVTVSDLKDYQAAIKIRLDFFNDHGCLLSDHSLDSGFQYESIAFPKADEIFKVFLKGKVLSESEIVQLQSYLLHFLGKEYASRNWKMQLHIGAYRFTNTKLRTKLGAAGGFACIGNTVSTSSLCEFLDDLDQLDKLPKTILYTLNPSDNAAFASLTGSYAEDNVMGKVQFGPAWWYNDHYEGITQQLIHLSSYGLLSTGIGFTTDSRSILSFTRHDYYRRILCDLVGKWVAEGKLPIEEKYLADLIVNLAYYNSKNWLNYNQK